MQRGNQSAVNLMSGSCFFCVSRRRFTPPPPHSPHSSLAIKHALKSFQKANCKHSGGGALSPPPPLFAAPPETVPILSCFHASVVCATCLPRRRRAETNRGGPHITRVELRRKSVSLLEPEHSRGGGERERRGVRRGLGLHHRGAYVHWRLVLFKQNSGGRCGPSVEGLLTGFILDYLNQIGSLN